MSNGEFWKFVKESKLTTKKFFGAQVDSIFSKANLEYDEAGRRKAQTVDQEDDNQTSSSRTPSSWSASSASRTRSSREARGRSAAPTRS